MKKPMSAKRIAFKDIHKYLMETHNIVIPNNYDETIVTRIHVDTEETKRLNRALGIHKVNKGKHNMARNKKS